MADNVEASAAPEGADTAAPESPVAVESPLASVPSAASEPVAAKPPASVGEALRAARVAHDLTVEQVAAELRIEPRQLAALEDNRFEQIGVPVFVKGYIRQYGQRFGLDIADLLALYYAQGKLADIELQPNRAIKLSDDRQVSSWIVAALVVATVLVAFAAWWWNGGTFEGVSNAVTTESTPVEPVPAAAAAAAVAVTEASAAPAAAAPPPAVAMPPDDAEVAAAAPAAATAAAPPAAEQDSSVAAAVETIPLEFRFVQESWAEVSDARGERLLFGLNAPGRQVTVRGEPPFSILLGNADSVELRVDGEPYAIPAESRQGSLARFSVDIAEE